MNFEIPDSHAIDVDTLKKQIYEYVKVLIARPNIPKEVTTKSADRTLDDSVFSCFSGDFGGNRDAHEIADELHDSRVFTRNTVAL